MAATRKTAKLRCEVKRLKTGRRHLVEQLEHALETIQALRGNADSSDEPSSSTTETG